MSKHGEQRGACVSACVRARVRASVRACVHAYKVMQRHDQNVVALANGDESESCARLREHDRRQSAIAVSMVESACVQGV
jgi:hypothetical protein